MHSNECRASTEESQALHTCVERLREVMEKTNTLIAPADTLTVLTQKLDECLALMIPHSDNRKRAMGYYNLNYPQYKLNDLQPYSPFIGEYNPLAPPLNCRVEGDKVVGEVTFNELYEGPPDCCHGGIISGVYDQLLAMASTVQNNAGPTAFLHIEYKNKTPLYKKIRFEAEVVRIKDKKIFVTGRSYCGDTLLSEAEALFINKIF